MRSDPTIAIWETGNELWDDGYTFHFPAANSTEQTAINRQLAYAAQVAGTS